MAKNGKCHRLPSSITTNHEQRLSEHLIESNTAKMINDDEYKLNKNDSIEHNQIVSHAEQLTSIPDKQKFNSSGIQSSINFSYDQYQFQRRYINQQCAEKKLIISKLEAENRYEKDKDFNSNIQIDF